MKPVCDFPSTDSITVGIHPKLLFHHDGCEVVHLLKRFLFVFFGAPV